MNAIQSITNTLSGRSPWSFAKQDQAATKPTSKTERMRNYLREHGAANAATLADEADVPQTALVGALLAGDLKKGRIGLRMGRYYWNHQFDADHHKRLAEAAALLRANGFKVEMISVRAAG